MKLPSRAPVDVVKFRWVQMSYWSSFATLLVFAIAYAADSGLKDSQITLMVAVSRIFAFAGQFFWGAIADRTQKNKVVFLITLVLTFVVCLGYHYSVNYPMFFVFYCLIGFIQTPVGSNLDTWIIKVFHGDGRMFARIRGMGAFGYAIFLLFYGMAVDYFGYDIMPWSMLALTILTFVIAWYSPEAPAQDPATSRRISVKEIGLLLKNKTYLFVLLVMFLIGLGSQTPGQIKYLIYKDVGASVVFQGYDGFVNGLFQTVGMFGASSVVRYIGCKKCLVLASVLATLQIVMLYIAKTPIVVLSSALFAGAFYGLLLPAYRELVQSVVEAGVITTAQGLTDALYGSAAGFIGGVFSSMIIDSLGMSNLVLICLGIEVVAMLLCVVMALKIKDRPGKAA